MLTPDQEKLKEAALAAEGVTFSTEGFEQSVGKGDFYGGLIMHENGHTIVAQCVTEPWATFISAANPAAILAILAQLEQVQGWRDLATSKPPEGVQVLIALDTGNVVTGFRFSAGWHWDETDCEADADATATHFQLLPPPPKAA